MACGKALPRSAEMLHTTASPASQSMTGGLLMGRMTGPVTLVLRRHVKAGREAEYEMWLAGLQEASRGVAGYLGVSTIRPAEGNVAREFVTIVRFDSYHNLRAWEESELRRQWNARLPVDAVDGDVDIRRLEGLEFWFQAPGAAAPVSPSAHKMAHSIELRGGVVSTHRKPPEVRICRLSIQSVVGTRPPSTSTPHWPAC